LLEGTIHETKYRIDEETMTKMSYMHVLDRMKRDLISSKIKSSEMESSLKNKSSILEIESMKQRKTKEERL